MGSDRRSSSIRIIKNGETRTNLQRERKFMEWLMIETMLILFPQTCILLVMKLHCMCLKTTKQWSRWSKREEARQWDMFPEPTSLLLISCLIESIWTARSKSSTLTPRSNSQTCWEREISHVMNGIIFCVCLTSAIPVPSIVLKRCRKEHKKMQVKKESQQSQSRWWIWHRDAAFGDPNVFASTASESPGKPNLKVRTYLVECAANKNRKTCVGR